MLRLVGRVLWVLARTVLTGLFLPALVIAAAVGTALFHAYAQSGVLGVGAHVLLVVLAVSLALVTSACTACFLDWSEFEDRELAPGAFAGLMIVVLVFLCVSPAAQLTQASVLADRGVVVSCAVTRVVPDGKERNFTHTVDCGTTHAEFPRPFRLAEPGGRLDVLVDPGGDVDPLPAAEAADQRAAAVELTTGALIGCGVIALARAGLWVWAHRTRRRPGAAPRAGVGELGAVG
ncbi:hypothetical protein [Actinokineospora sp. NBRC 105648]|uniref:hypothetical protein n=1 Tax=Actinokineospora sp. NBRC 105648 TaxID=3032206 RepID=UPI0024A2BFB4|nr:hypothetical protein [Actinokineospora sp. NBRC 105648]GLZ37546.1 hypothetical protein Acsp05_11710 [Actinokineospora sp. NBRC 105648]